MEKVKRELTLFFGFLYSAVVKFFILYDYTNHWLRMVAESYSFVEFIYCHCNCGKTRPRFDIQGRERKYFRGHSSKVRIWKDESRKKISEFSKTRIREKHPGWKGGSYYRRGYKYIYKPDYPFSNKDGYIREHRFIYETHYKCCLLPWTDVHHINGIKDDNRIENLEALIHGKHTILSHTKDMSDRFCANCNGKSLIIKNKITTWMKNPIGEGYLCKRCVDNLLYRLKTVGW